MVIRYGLRCPGCSEPFICRVGTDSTAGTKFYFPCPYCALPIRALARGDDVFEWHVDFDCDVLPADEVEGAKVVTANPFVPAKSDADFDDPTRAFPTLTLVNLLGDDGFVPFMQSIGGARGAIQDLWPPVRRIYEYYLDENWRAFDRALSVELPNMNWPSGDTVHERATRAHTAVLMVTSQLVPRSDQLELFAGRWARKYTAAIDSQNYRSRFVEDRDSGLLARLQRAIFDLIDLFVRRGEMWAMGALPRAIPEDRRPLLEGLVLARDEFGELRDLYQQAFELICKTLRYLVAAQNTVKRGDPDDFGSDHPTKVPVRARATSIRKFDELANAFRIAYVAQVPGWEGFSSFLDNRVRNTIGHGAVRHDLRSGRVVSDTDPTGVSYLDFVAGVYDLFEDLTAALQIVRGIRVLTSPDFTNA